jgi:hypothetical protein
MHSSSTLRMDNTPHQPSIDRVLRDEKAKSVFPLPRLKVNSAKQVHPGRVQKLTKLVKPLQLHDRTKSLQLGSSGSTIQAEQRADKVHFCDL